MLPALPENDPVIDRERPRYRSGQSTVPPGEHRSHELIWVWPSCPPQWSTAGARRPEPLSEATWDRIDALLRRFQQQPNQVPDDHEI